ncbi:MAG TPA: DUF5680 domain-containing protein [bacterium]|jgi:hypothetical protein|nr:DUF5680 domain-containing protein [bacterium]HOG38662.1 DUF5680 domain-containing protein [bacterium]HQI03521.1 DUF5680 domain-containing protein [bacterium]
MFNKKELCKFLVEAKKSTYASGDATKEIKEENKSKTLIFEKGDFKYHDNYFGGEPYGGREVVFFQNQAVYMMVYYGYVNEKINDFKDVYKVLRGALLLIPEENPYRGPKEYIDGDYIYANNFIGEVDNFSGEEIITYKGEEIYRAKYIGGFIDKKK